MIKENSCASDSVFNIPPSFLKVSHKVQLKIRLKGSLKQLANDDNFVSKQALKKYLQSIANIDLQKEIINKRGKVCQIHDLPEYSSLEKIKWLIKVKRYINRGIQVYSDVTKTRLSKVLVNQVKASFNRIVERELPGNSLLPMAIYDHATELVVNSGPITMGYGEYVVFYNSNHDYPEKEIEQETFNKIHEIFNAYSPSIGTCEEEELEDRYANIKKHVQKIDDALEIAFIPRTLYELFLVRKCMKEDFSRKKHCPKIGRSLMGHKFSGEHDFFSVEEVQNEKHHRKCWHIGYFLDSENRSYNNNKHVQEIAYRLNKNIVKNLGVTEAGYSLKKLLQHTKDKIVFLKEARIKYQQLESKLIPSQIRDLVTVQGFLDKKYARVIKNTVALECSQKAQNALLFYRGSRLAVDHVAAKKSKYDAHCLSYGTGLFAGSMYDGGERGATVMHYMSIKNNTAHVMVVPYKERSASPFYCPHQNAIVQFYGAEEFFHARSKVWGGCNALKRISGIIPQTKVLPEQWVHLQSKQKKSELVREFEKYKKNAFILD